MLMIKYQHCLKNFQSNMNVNVLLLGPTKKNQEILYRFFIEDGCKVKTFEEKLSIDHEFLFEYDFLISYGYRHILESGVLKHFENKAINLHISYLPWNRGADPNLWSIIKNTPKGVTIHLIDCGIDTGHILYQKEVWFDDNDTLYSSYQKLHSEILDLFKLNWINIKSGHARPTKQKGLGSFHLSREKDRFKKFLTNGWDTKIGDIKKSCNIYED